MLFLWGVSLKHFDYLEQLLLADGGLEHDNAPFTPPQLFTPLALSINVVKLMARILTKFIFFILRFLCYYLKS